MTEQIDVWTSQLKEAVERKDIAAVLEIKGWIDAKLAQLVEDVAE